MWTDTAWIHVVVGTLRSWDFGDERGFRSRGHRIHSSGDYKNPPPKKEHEGLRKRSRRNAAPRVVIPEKLRKKLGAAFIRKLQALGCRVIAGAVAGKHGHFLVEMPYDYKKERTLVGKAKNISSYLVRDEMPGRVWAAGGRFRLIKDRKHQVTVFWYIKKRQVRGAWTWVFFEELPEVE